MRPQYTLRPRQPTKGIQVLLNRFRCSLQNGFKAWPIAAWARYNLIFLALFLPVYALGLWRGGMAPAPHVLAMAWERGIPLVPWMAVAYLSLFATYSAPLFLLPAAGFKRLTSQSILVILISGLIFVAVPTRSGFADAGAQGAFSPLLNLVASVDRPFNLFPSLHVAGAALVLLASAQCAGKWTAFLLKGWLALIAVSTVLIHQHHLIDVAGGWSLAILARRLYPITLYPVASGQAESRPTDR